MSWLRRVAPFLTAVVLIAALYDGFVFYSRWQARRDAEKAGKQRESERARQTIDMLGGGQLKILHFYASPGKIRRGQSANLCFNVFGASRVRIDPPIAKLHPAVSYCFPASPLGDTAYTLTAEDDAGHSTSEKVTLQVIP